MGSKDRTVAGTVDRPHAVRVVARLARLFERELAGAKLSLPQYRLLAFLSDGDWAASALADWLAVSRPSITSLVDGLVERGLVERAACETDRRRVLHRLTAAGEAAVTAATTTLGDALAGVIGELDPDEQRRAEDGLAVLGLGLQRHHGKGER